MMIYKRSSVLIVMCLAVLPVFSQMATSSKPSGSSEEQKKARVTRQSEGERKFAQNCSRCHDAPQGFSPSISGTIVRHMRVRASLGKQDEEDILHFLNP
jgi:mono/diheme cytochrome c family protein